MESLSSPSSLTRRNFLQLSAGAVAAVAVFSMPKIPLAEAAAPTTVKLAECPENPQIVAQSSPLIKADYERLQQSIDSIHDTGLRTMIQRIVSNPAPTFMEQYTSSDDRERMYSQLSDAGLVDKNRITAQTLFPPLKDAAKAPQPFITAPGSGYDSHHSYPGGLVTHVINNVTIVQGIYNSYSDIFSNNLNYDMAVGGELMHDIAKPWVFQWRQDGSSLVELTLAQTGAHHIFSIAETIYRGFPAELIVAQACAHDHPGSPADEALVVGWIKAAAYIAGKDPVKLGLLSASGDTLPTPHKQEGYIVHLGDHDWVLSVPAAQQSVAMLRQIAQKEYGMSAADLNSLKFNKLRNYVGANLSFMRLHHALSAGSDPYGQALSLVRQAISV